MVSESAQEVVSIICEQADQHNLLWQLTVACAYAESRLNPLSRRPSDPSKYALYWAPPDPFDISGGLGQKVVRWMQPYIDWCTTNKHDPDIYPGDSVISDMLDLLNDPHEAARIMCDDLVPKWRLYRPSMEKTLAAYNWPAGEGAFYSAAHEQNYRDGLKAAENILGVPMSPVTYNANEPAHPQEHGYDCSQDSLEWALTAVGRKPQDNWMEPTMIAEGVMSESQGLLDATGAGLAAFVGRHYGEFGYYANNEPSVTFDGAALEGDHAYPILIGGRAWGHWSGVRGYDAARDLLLLANPSDGWMGVGQTMNRAQFDQLGPFSMVRVLHPDLLAPPVVVPPAPEFDRAAVAARLRALLALHVQYDAAVRSEYAKLIEMTEVA